LTDGIPMGFEPLLAVRLLLSSFMAPEVVLISKAAFTREKDQQDFEAILPFLGTREREWLRDAITRRWRSAQRRAGDGGSAAREHPWTSSLTEPPGRTVAGNREGSP
jgi:hypothetical protein